MKGEQARLEPNVELALCRIAQEALNNVHRHAHASQAQVMLVFDSDTVTLTITDDGEGFDPQQSLAGYATAGHFGLMGAYERTEQLGGEFNLTSNLDQGTILCIVVPRQPKLPPSE
jgi:signal transduction histidine kinase